MYFYAQNVLVGKLADYVYHPVLSYTTITFYTFLQCESKKSPQNYWEFFNQILHAYYAFLSTLDYGFLFSYLQL